MLERDGENRSAMTIADTIPYARQESKMNTDYVCAE